MTINNDTATEHPNKLSRSDIFEIQTYRELRVKQALESKLSSTGHTGPKIKVILFGTHGPEHNLFESVGIQSRPRTDERSSGNRPSGQV